MIATWANLFWAVNMNAGKVFEEEFKESVKKYNEISNDIYLLRLQDSASGFGMDSSKVRFSAKSPFDFLMYHRSGKLFALELKSCGENSVAFSLDNDKKSIKSSQVKNLKKSSFYGIISGFLFNFRKFEETYFLDIDRFLEFAESTEKKSINRDDVISFGGLLVPQKKKKVKYIYDIEILLKGVEQNK